MKKVLVVILLAGLAGILPLAAQTTTLHVKVPFTFVAGDQQFPAGNYDLKYHAPERMIVLAARESSPMAYLVPLAMAVELNTDAGSRLLFHKYGEEYCLRGVAFDNGATSFTLAPTKVERTRLKKVPFEVAVFKADAR